MDKHSAHKASATTPSGRGSQGVWWRGWFVPDGVVLRIAIEIPLTVDVNIEFELDIAIPTCKNHAVRYRSSPDLSAFDHLEPFEHFVKYIYVCTLRRR